MHTPMQAAMAGGGYMYICSYTDAVSTRESLILDEWLFSQYIKLGHCYATQASNAVKKWLKPDVGLIARSLRHTLRDPLKALECSMDMIDQIGWWRSVGWCGGEIW
jgi:hypothetical protein